MTALMRAILILVSGLLAGPLLINAGFKDKESKALRPSGKPLSVQVTHGDERVDHTARRPYWPAVFFGCLILLGTFGYMAYLWHTCSGRLEVADSQPLFVNFK